jgi:hypothetical protein
MKWQSLSKGAHITFLSWLWKKTQESDLSNLQGEDEKYGSNKEDYDDKNEEAIFRKEFVGLLNNKKENKNKASCKKDNDS